MKKMAKIQSWLFIKRDSQTPICHPERSEGSPIAQNKKIRYEILRLTAQNDKRVGVETRPYGWIDKPQFVELNIFAALTS